MDKSTLDWMTSDSTEPDYLTMVTYTADGVTDQYEFNFPGGYLNKADIKAYMFDPEGVVRTDLAVEFISDNLVKLSPAQKSGNRVTIYRDTPKELPLVSFTDGAMIEARNLDRNAKQCIFAVSEILDKYNIVYSQVELAEQYATVARDSAEVAVTQAAFVNSIYERFQLTDQLLSEIQASVTSAQDAAVASVAASQSASTSADAATAVLGQVIDEAPVYSSVSDALANTTDGQVFRVFSGSGADTLFMYYRNSAGTAVLIGETYSATAIRRNNILFDAFNEYSATDLKFAAWDWYRGATVSFSTSDANIPLPTPVAQYSGVWSADKYYDLSRLPVRVGDQVSFSVLAWFQNSGAKFHLFWMSSAGTVVSSKSQLGLVAGVNRPVITDVIPAGATYVRIRVENTTTGVFKVGAYAAALGSIKPEFVRAAPDKAYMAAIISSGISGLTSRVDALQGAISVGYAYSATWQTGKFINPNTGVVTDNTALNCTIIPHSDGDGWLVTALVTGSATALAVYMNAAGTVLGVEGRGTTTPQQYTNYRLNVPSGTTQIGITGRNSSEMYVKKLAVVETASVLSSIDALDVRVQKIEESLVYDFVKQDVPITAGAYINRANGAIVSNSAFDCALFDYTTGDRWKVTARVNGSGVSLAVYINSVGVVIGTEVDGTAESVDCTDYELSPPVGTAKIGITTRTTLPIVAKKYVVVPGGGGTVTSPWSGKVIDVLGDSNVAYNKWQPLVAEELGCSFLNHGVGGSKIAKPDSAASQISMCDDVRINALNTSADVWICGPWGTNDWAQNIPLGSITDTVNTTVYGALNIIAQKLRARAPTKPIFWATPFNGDYDAPRSSAWVDGETNQYGRVSDYAAAIRAVALRYGFPLIDLNATCGWTKFNSSNFLLVEGTTNLSRIHLNDSHGAPRIKALFVDGLSKLSSLSS